MPLVFLLPLQIGVIVLSIYSPPVAAAPVAPSPQLDYGRLSAPLIRRSYYVLIQLVVHLGVRQLRAGIVSVSEVGCIDRRQILFFKGQ